MKETEREEGMKEGWKGRRKEEKKEESLKNWYDLFNHKSTDGHAMLLQA